MGLAMLVASTVNLFYYAALQMQGVHAMAILVHSPYSGHQVKVRDEDIERAIRDPQGKVFYVVEREGGKGHYASPTRKGSPRDEAKYDELLAKIESGELVPEHDETEQAPAVHDATGKRKLVSSSKLLIFILAIIVALVVVYFYFVAPASAQGAINASPWPDNTVTLAQVSPLPANPATLPADVEEDPEAVAARNRFALRVFAVGGALGLVLIYLVAKYGNRKRRENMDKLQAHD